MNKDQYTIIVLLLTLLIVIGLVIVTLLYLYLVPTTAASPDVMYYFPSITPLIPTRIL